MTYSNFLLSTTNPTLAGLELNVGLCGKGLEYNLLNFATDVDLSVGVKCINLIFLVSIETYCQW